MMIMKTTNGTGTISYSEYLAEQIDRTISYSEYLGYDTLLAKAKSKVIAVNRQRQIDGILYDIDFDFLKLEDTDEYKEYRRYR